MPAGPPPRPGDAPPVAASRPRRAVRAGLACGLALLVLVAGVMTGMGAPTFAMPLVLVLVALGLGGRRALATRAVLLWSAAILAVMLLAFVAWGVWQVHHDGFL